MFVHGLWSIDYGLFIPASVFHGIPDESGFCNYCFDTNYISLLNIVVSQSVHRHTIGHL